MSNRTKTLRRYHRVVKKARRLRVPLIAGVRAAPPTVEEMFGATLSPSGRYLAVIAPVDGGRRGVGIMVAINRNGDSQRVRNAQQVRTSLECCAPSHAAGEH